MKYKAIVLAVFSFLAVSVYGQTQNIGKVPDQAFKVATVDFRTAIVTTADGQQASKDLQDKFAAVIAELQDLNKKVNDTKTKVEALKKSDPSKDQLEKDLAKLTQNLNEKNMHVEADIKAAQTEVVVKIGKGLVEVIDKYAQDNGYTAVLDSSAQSSQLLFASPSLDITKDIVKLYDQAHPAKVTPVAAPASK